jgi:hypothetical protein
MIHREHPLQRGWLSFCKRCIAVPFEPASHDRAAARSANDHIWQTQRGIRRAWPDTELALNGGRTFRCEFKAPGVKLDRDGDQGKLLRRLNELGHTATWANSIVMYGEECERFGVPLRANWRTVAKVIDEHVLADIRQQEVAAEVAKDTAASTAASTVKFRTVRRGKLTTAQIRRITAARIKTLP